MAFPVAGTPVTTQFAFSVTSFSVNLPSGIAAGDRLIIAADFRSSGTISQPGGYSVLRAVNGGGGVGRSVYWERICDGTEGSTATFGSTTGTSAVFQVIKITGAHASTPSEFSNPGAAGDVSAVNPQGVTASWGSDDNLFIAFGASSAATMNFTAAPTNYGSLVESNASSGGGRCTVASAQRNLAAASDDPGAFTTSSNRWWSAGTLVIRPAAAPAGGGQIKVYLSGSFVAKPVKVYLSGSFVAKPLKFYDGADWVETSY